MELHQYCLISALCGLVFLVVWVPFVHWLQNCQGSLKLAPAHWPEILRMTLPFVVTLLLTPAFICGFAFVAGFVLSSAEGWSIDEAVVYIVANMLQVEPMVTVVPDSVLGQWIDILVSVCSLMFSATILGLISSMRFVEWMGRMQKASWCGLAAMWGAIFIVLLGVAFLCALVLMALEDVGMWPAFLYMAGLLCSIEDPLSGFRPRTAEGEFFVGWCYTVELGCSGAIIGLLNANAKIQWVLSKLEGVTDEGVELDGPVAEPAKELSVLSPNGEAAAADANSADEVAALLERLRKSGAAEADLAEVRRRLLRGSEASVGRSPSLPPRTASGSTAGHSVASL